MSLRDTFPGLCLCTEPHEWAPTACVAPQDPRSALLALLSRLRLAKEDPTGSGEYGDGTTANPEIVSYMVCGPDLDAVIALAVRALIDAHPEKAD